MISLVIGIAMAVHIGPMAPDAPAHEPQLAVNGSTVALAFGAGKAIYVATSKDGGASFAPPVKVAEAPVVPLTRHRGPRIAFASGAIVVTAVVGRTLAEGPHAHGLPSDGDLVAWRSTDGGKSWSKGVQVNDVPSAPTEGLHGLATDGKGTLFVAWLDKRSHGTKLYGSRSTDGGITWSGNLPIYESPNGTICECCHPSVAIDSGDQILVMWRNWLDGSRDMYLARSVDGAHFSRPEKLGMGTWKLNACPMDGGGVAVAGNRIVTAWRREHTVFLATPGGKETPLADGTDVAIAPNQSGVYAVWSSPAGIAIQIPGWKAPLALSDKGSFPNVATLSDGHALVAWEDDGKIVIRQVP
jgi:hypothetical protein